MGDVAMLQVAFQRLQRLWPEAEILVVTDRPDRLLRALPGAIPVPSYGYLLGPLHKLLPGLDRWAFAHTPQFALLIMKAFAKLIPSVGLKRDMDSFTRIVAQTRLVVASGGGYMTDAFDFFALPILETLAVAGRLGKTTAMLGQGLGPFTPDARLLESCARTLPNLDRLMIREKAVAPAQLAALKVPAERVVITGDDAIELARKQATERLGDALGVNVRRMDYAQVDQSSLQVLRDTLSAAADALDAPLVPLPVSVSSREADHETIREMLSGVARFTPLPPPSQPTQLIEQVTRCRVVVTGAYHAAVFALSCGIPAICLVRSPYYQQKMGGLADLFGDGCTLVRLDEENLKERLDAAIQSAWQSAERVRPGLLAAADRQIKTGADAYSELVALARSRA